MARWQFTGGSGREIPLYNLDITPGDIVDCSVNPDAVLFRQIDGNTPVTASLTFPATVATVDGVTLTVRGGRLPSTSYAVNDAVCHDGQAWRCVVAYTSAAGSYFNPAQAVHWTRATITNTPPVSGASATDVLVSNRCFSQRGNVVVATGTYRWTFTARVNATDLRFKFSHVLPTTLATPEAEPAGSITFSASFDDGTSVIPLTRNGAKTFTVTSGYLETDPLPVEVKAGTTYYVRTYVSAGTVYAVGATTQGTDGFNAADLTAPGASVPGYQFVYAYGPSSISGRLANGAVRKPSIAAIGDSVARGLFDDGQGVVADGFIGRAAEAAGWPWINCALSSSWASQYALPGSRRVRGMLTANADHVVSDFAGNDLVNSRTPTQIEADLVTIWRAAASRGSHVWQTTITPLGTTSTDGWATVANQTPHANAANRVTVNTWIRAGAPIDPTTLAPVAVGTSGALVAGQSGHPLDGYFEIADIVESARDSGKWKATGRAVTDAAVSTGAPTTLTSATAAFTSADTGKTVQVNGAGASGANLATTITYVNATTVTLAVGASTTVSGAVMGIGTNGWTIDGTHPAGVVPYTAMAAGVDTSRLAGKYRTVTTS